MDYKLRQTDAEVLICDGAKVCGDVSLAPGVSVWYNAVLRGDEGAISVGEGTNIQDCAVLHEETRVGAAPAATEPSFRAAPSATTCLSAGGPW